MNRGDLVTVALAGDYGKPHPALIVQSDLFPETATVTVLLLSSTLVATPLLRIDILPDASNNLRAPSQIMIDKAMSVRRDRLGPVFGRIDRSVMASVTRAFATFMGVG